jgi:hypothetical protein
MKKDPASMFEDELSAVFVRWWEESDLDENEMAQIALVVVERFCDTTVEFEADFELEDDD